MVFDYDIPEDTSPRDPSDPWPDVTLRGGDEDEVIRMPTSLVSHILGDKDGVFRMLPELPDRESAGLPPLQPLLPQNTPQQPAQQMMTPPGQAQQMQPTPNDQDPDQAAQMTQTPAFNMMQPPGLDPMSLMYPQNTQTQPTTPPTPPGNTPRRTFRVDAEDDTETSTGEMGEMTDPAAEIDQRIQKFKSWEQKNRPKRERPKMTSAEVEPLSEAKCDVCLSGILRLPSGSWQHPPAGPNDHRATPRDGTIKPPRKNSATRWVNDTCRHCGKEIAATDKRDVWFHTGEPPYPPSGETVHPAEPKTSATYPEEDRRRIHEETADDEHVRGPVSRRHLRDHGFGITLDPAEDIPDEDLKRIHATGHPKQSSKTARRDLSLQEKQALIEEDGEALNKTKLDLTGTHYENAETYYVVGPLFGL